MTDVLIDGYRYTETDARRTLLPLAEWMDLLAHGRDASSVAGIHARLVDDLRTVLGVTDIGTDLAHLARLAAKSDTDLLPDLVRCALNAVAATGEALREHGQMPATSTGTVHQLSRSKGGVPKGPVESVDIDLGGVLGDRQATRFHHGRPWQALCLWSLEVIEAFVADGHPIFPGAAGENVTVSGLDWSSIAPGVRLQIGTALCEASLWALPCSSNRPWFRQGDFSLMHHERGPVSRMYATVLRPGHASVGDSVILEP